MKDKNTLIGTILIGLLFAGLFYYQSLTDPSTPASQSKKENKKEVESKETKTQEVVSNEPVFIQDSAATLVNEEFLELENDKLKVTFTNKGGSIASVEIKDYLTWDKKSLVLFNKNSQQFQYLLSTSKGKVGTSSLFFTPNQLENSITYSTTLSSGEKIEQVYKLSPNDYKLNYDVAINGVNQPLELDWKSKLLTLEHSVSTERNYSALYYRSSEGKVDHLDEAKDKDEAKVDKQVDWISFKQQFFNATWVPKGGVSNVSFSTLHDKDKTDYVKNYVALGTITPKSGSVNLKTEWIFSPNRYGLLKELGTDLEDIVKLSPDNFVFKWIKYITKIYTIPTLNILEKAGLNYGIIILLLTILLKLLLTPLTWSSIKSSAFMKALKPDIDALKEKYGDDQQKISAEQMKIYQQAGVNPLGGCLPMLLQLPILLSMYYFFPNSIELRQQPFLWANDLSSYDAIYTFKEAIFGQSHISLFTILMTLTSIAMAVYTQANSGMANTQPGMQYIPYIMPVFLMFIFNSFPAALTYYYLLQNVISMAQQWFIQKFFIKEESIKQIIEQNKKNPKAPSKWTQKLEEIQKQQQSNTKKK